MMDHPKSAAGPEWQSMLEALLHGAPGMAYRCRHDRRRTAEFVSDGAGAVTGYPAVEFIEHRVHYGELIHPDDQARVREAVDASLAARDRYFLSYRIIAAGGSPRPVREQGRGVYAPDGAILGLDGFITDTADPRATGAEVSGSEQRYRSLFAANPNPMWVYDLETLRFLAVNDAATRHYGYAQEEFLHMTIADIRPAEEVARLVENVRAVTSGLDEAGCWRHRRKDGSIIEVEITSHTLDFDGRRAELVLALDVTERRRTEAAMRLQSSALNAAANAIMITDRNGVIEWVNPAWTSLTGYTVAEAVGNTPRILKSGAQDADFYDEFWRTVLGGTCVQGELINRRKDGTLYHEHETITPVADEAGRITHFIAIKQDITERKRADADRERESSLLLSTLRSLPGVFYLYDADRRLLRWNDNFARATGYSAAELAGRPPFDFLAPEDHATVRTRIDTVFTDGAADFEGHLLSRDGTRTPYFFTGVRVELEGRPHLVGVGVDITERQRAEQQIRKLAAFPRLNPNPVLEFSAEGTCTYANPAAHAMAREIGVDDLTRLLPAETSELVRTCLATGQPQLRVLTRHGSHTISWSFNPIAAEGVVHCYAGDITARLALEEQLRQSQKMDAIGQLAGGVAHDFNNLLTVIHGNVSMARLQDTSPTEKAEALDEIAGAATRAAALTRQLLTFSRRQIMQPRPVDLNETVTSITRMLQRVLGEQVHLQLHLHPQPITTPADPGMLDQVIMNLAVNARDAMPGGGTLTLATDLIALGDEDHVLFPEARPGQHACLRVTDTGCGIAPENLPHIFEPFFTTKEPGKGTGLGLATVFGIVKQHGGTLRVSSIPGQGTIFEILLPVDATATAHPVAAGQAAPPRASGETILVVEDELAVRRLAARVLEAHGYHVLEAGDGREALQVFAAATPRPDLLITDMIMPAGLTGRELAERLRVEAPDLRTLYMSGYAGDNIRRGLNLQEGLNFLAKPFQPDSLLHCVRARLDAPA